jgi:DNA-directed RNA polymerase subunit RPC12/RpoP
MVLFNEKIKMMDYIKHCFIYGHVKFDKYVYDYLRCQRCNHEILDSDLMQKFIINSVITMSFKK